MKALSILIFSMVGLSTTFASASPGRIRINAVSERHAVGPWIRNRAASERHAVGPWVRNNRAASERHLIIGSSKKTNSKKSTINLNESL